MYKASYIVKVTFCYLLLLSTNCFGSELHKNWYNVKQETTTPQVASDKATTTSISTDSISTAQSFATTESFNKNGSLRANESLNTTKSIHITKLFTTTESLNTTDPPTTNEYLNRTRFLTTTSDTTNLSAYETKNSTPSPVFNYYCMLSANGTEVCYEKCVGEDQLKCPNGGACVLDENKNQICRCRESFNIGPNCDVLETTAAGLYHCDERLYFIILIVACIIIVILILINIATIIYFRRRQRKAKKDKNDLHFDTRMFNNGNSNRGTPDDPSRLRGHTNDTYFANPVAVSHTALEPAVEETETSSTHRTSIHQNIYASIDENFRNERPSIFLDPAPITRG